MSKSYTVAVAGATGAVGVEMIKTLEKRNFPVKNLKLLASARSAGKTMEFRGEKLVIEEMTENSFKGVDIALFSAGSDISRAYRTRNGSGERLKRGNGIFLAILCVFLSDTLNRGNDGFPPRRTEFSHLERLTSYR